MRGRISMANEIMENYDPNQERINRRIQMAQQLQQYGEQAPDTYKIAGQEWKDPWSALAHALTQTAGGYFQGRANKSEEKYGMAKNAALASALQAGRTAPETQMYKGKQVPVFDQNAAAPGDAYSNTLEAQGYGPTQGPFGQMALEKYKVEHEGISPKDEMSAKALAGYREQTFQAKEDRIKELYAALTASQGKAAADRLLKAKIADPMNMFGLINDLPGGTTGNPAPNNQTPTGMQQPPMPLPGQMQPGQALGSGPVPGRGRYVQPPAGSPTAQPVIPIQPPLPGDRPNIGQTAPPAGGPEIAPGVPMPNDRENKLDEEYLKTIPPMLATQVRALAEGREKFPSGLALRSPYWQGMLAALGQYDPNFDETSYGSRSKTRNAFTAGKEASNIRSINQAIGHLGTLDSLIPQTSGISGFPGARLVNSGLNSIAADFNRAGPVLWNQTADKLASELTSLFRGSGGAEADVKRNIEQLNGNLPTDVKRKLTRNIAELVNSRLAELAQQYNQGMGTTSEPYKFLNPHAQQIFNRLSPDFQGSGQQDASQQSPPPNLLKEGHNTTFANGQTWVLQGGQPKRIK